MQFPGSGVKLPRVRAVAVVVIGEEQFTVEPDHPFVFGRDDADDVIGLDRKDMGISAQAGSVEWDRSLWWVVNRSRKRPLLLDGGVGGPLHHLKSGLRLPISAPRSSVLVPGVVHTHRIEVLVPVEDLACFQPTAPPSGTITGEVRLSENDRDVATALFSGYLEEFPRRELRPRTYQQAADLLGSPWTKTTVRKQIERLRLRLAEVGMHFDGPPANFELADHFIQNGVLTSADLGRLVAHS